MVQYKWVALSNTTIAMLMASIDMTIVLIALPANFEYFPFALILLVMGIGNGIFMSPNMASVMNSCPPEHRGVASVMRSTLQNCGQTISQAIFFAIIIISLDTSLPGALVTAVAIPGAPAQIVNAFHSVPASGALFAAFLGYNPIRTLLQSMGPTVASHAPAYFQHTYRSELLRQRDSKSFHECSNGSFHYSCGTLFCCSRFLSFER